MTTDASGERPGRRAALRLGLLGTSRIAREQHLPAARRSDRVRVVAVASRDPVTAASFAKAEGIERAYGSYEELLADPDVEAVLITVPNALHHRWVLAALAARKHVLCEKPLAMSLAEGVEMAEAAARADRHLVEAFTTRHAPGPAAIRAHLAAGTVGGAWLLRVELRYRPDWATDSRTRADLGGGSLMDCGCYAVDLVCDLFGAPTAVLAAQRIRASHGVDATFLGTLLFAGDRMATILSSQESLGRFTCELVGERGQVRIDDMYGDRLDLEVDGRKWSQPLGIVDRFRLQLEDFADGVASGARSARTPIAASLLDLAALDALREAAVSGRSVSVAQVAA